MKPVFHLLGPLRTTNLNRTTVRQSEFTAYTARAKATLPSLPAVSLFHIPLCRTRRWWQASWIGYVSPALLYQASPAPLIMGQTENASCVQRATPTTVELDAKMDAETAALRPALASGYVELMTRARCLRILTSEDGTKATGVLVERDGEQRLLHADIVAVCAGVGRSAHLLLKSRTTKHPHGIGNSSQCVGHYYGGHTAGMLFPMLSFTKKLPEMHTKTFAINAYYNGAPDWPYPLGVIQAVGQVPFWDRDVVAWWKRYPARLVGERSLFCLYMTEALPTKETGFQVVEGRIVGMRPPVQNTATFKKLRLLAIDVFRRAGYQVVAPRHQALYHPTGTVVFGVDPRFSVLDRNCKVHDIDRLFVVDASVLPSAGAVNTGLTIAALALKVGDAIAGIKYSESNKFVSSCP